MRDPSALLMGPMAKDKESDVTLLPVQRAPEPSEKAVKVARTALDKTPLQKGKRAVALPVDESQLLALKPGDRVDVIGVFDAAASSGARRAYAATILQNARVLGVATTGDLRAQGVLTLELNPVEAQYALLFARRTELGVTVRAPGNPETHPFELANFGKLFR